ncbi:2'-5' RNA ligase family protein [Nocardia sp. CDC153]|uniref:2'-5' RNA ligase family protein n=1 Tax=Nocardia sp. CDC153 TaxID=3112167 RepID=UPI002DBF1936|nr:2'-5' RNA ligase family protein [Nocardia sp. CDC153]MEC3952868.1 2'-5' RNA ligase family protein [Nocardia sp. CDC153]
MADEQSSEPMIRDARSGTFPPALPASLSDRRSICENDWEAFRKVPQMIDHWGRRDWPADHETYFWYLTFRDPELIQLARHCNDTLNLNDVDFVPLDGLHITMLRIADLDEVKPEDVEAIADIAKPKLNEFEPFSLEVGPLAGSRGAIRFTVSPWTELFNLHQIVRKSTRQILPSIPLATTENFRPHLGIGYSNRKQDAKPIIDQISTIRDLKTATVQVDSIKIVKLRRESQAYRWNDAATLELGR